MTEAGRASTLHPQPRPLRRALACVTLAMASLVWATPVAVAAPAPTESETKTESETRTETPEAAEQAPAGEPAIRSALADGDLSTASELAVELREAEPTVDHYRLEAEVWEALGDYENAKEALDGALEALPEDAEAEAEAIEDERDRLEALSRGTVADEPESSHRERLDEERAERLAALMPKTPPPPKVVDEAPKRKPIIKQWYFWVTLASIVGAAGAIVGVAVSSAVDERKQANGVGRLPAPAGGLTIRF